MSEHRISPNSRRDQQYEALADIAAPIYDADDPAEVRELQAESRKVVAARYRDEAVEDAADAEELEVARRADDGYRIGVDELSAKYGL